MWEKDKGWFQGLSDEDGYVLKVLDELEWKDPRVFRFIVEHEIAVRPVGNLLNSLPVISAKDKVVSIDSRERDVGRAAGLVARYAFQADPQGWAAFNKKYPPPPPVSAGPEMHALTDADLVRQQQLREDSQRLMETQAALARTKLLYLRPDQPVDIRDQVAMEQARQLYAEEFRREYWKRSESEHAFEELLMLVAAAADAAEAVNALEELLALARESEALEIAAGSEELGDIGRPITPGSGSEPIIRPGPNSPVPGPPEVRPAPKTKYVNLASPQRTTHILTGDATGGGHMWPGAPERHHSHKVGVEHGLCTKYSDIATDPSLTWVQQTGRPGVSLTMRAGSPARFSVTGTRDGVTIRVVIEPAGEGIITAHPLP